MEANNYIFFLLYLVCLSFVCLFIGKIRYTRLIEKAEGSGLQTFHTRSKTDWINRGGILLALSLWTISTFCYIPYTLLTLNASTTIFLALFVYLGGISVTVLLTIRKADLLILIDDTIYVSDWGSWVAPTKYELQELTWKETAINTRDKRDVMHLQLYKDDRKVGTSIREDDVFPANKVFCEYIKERLPQRL